MLHRAVLVLLWSALAAQPGRAGLGARAVSRPITAEDQARAMGKALKRAQRIRITQGQREAIIKGICPGYRPPAPRRPWWHRLMLRRG